MAICRAYTGAPQPITFIVQPFDPARVFFPSYAQEAFCSQNRLVKQQQPLPEPDDTSLRLALLQKAFQVDFSHAEHSLIVVILCMRPTESRIWPSVKPLRPPLHWPLLPLYPPSHPAPPS